MGVEIPIPPILIIAAASAADRLPRIYPGNQPPPYLGEALTRGARPHFYGNFGSGEILSIISDALGGACDASILPVLKLPAFF